MRIVSWNMCYWQKKNSHKDAWDYLINELQPDIALVQEACPPEDILEGSKLIWHPILEKGNWGSGIYSKNYPLREIDFENSYPGSLVGAVVSLPGDRKIAVFSLYGQLEKKNGCSTAYATTSVHKMLSDLTWVLMGHGRFGEYASNAIIGGDFNISIQCDDDQKRKNALKYTKAHRIVFERIEDFGFKSIIDWSDVGGFTQTHRHSKSQTPWQNDYIFVSASLNEKKVISEVKMNNRISELSDHNPIVVDFMI